MILISVNHFGYLHKIRSLFYKRENNIHLLTYLAKSQSELMIYLTIDAS